MDITTAMPISFELFPPNTTQGMQKLGQICDSLNAFRPDYFSVTFGAGGANQDKTFCVVKLLLEQQLAVTPHLSCLGLSKEIIRQALNTYIEWGITRIVAIRGDLPAGAAASPGDFQHADELIQFIRKETGNHFHISIAAYPEFHPQSPNVFTALENFSRKVRAGANVAITQYFFNPDAYFYFLESCAKAGITIPIIPGIMPIYSCEKLLRFSNLCGAEVPAWLLKRLEAYCHDEDSLQAFGIEVVTKLCETLVKGGAPGLHFYTLNKCQPTEAILKNLALQRGHDEHLDRYSVRNMAQ